MSGTTELETIRAALQAGLRASDESTGALMLAGLVALELVAEDSARLDWKVIGRESQMIAMRQAGQTLQQIAAVFNISRERVRQILGPLGIRKPDPPQRWPIPGFGVRMRRWLQSAGYRKCADCQVWQTGVSVSNRRCSPCNRRNALQRYHTEQGKAYAAEYRKKHPEVNKRATARHIEKHKNDPEWLEKRREWRSERYRKEVSTEEGRLQLRAYERATYARRKAERTQQPEGRP